MDTNIIVLAQIPSLQVSEINPLQMKRRHPYVLMKYQGIFGSDFPLSFESQSLRLGIPNENL